MIEGETNDVLLPDEGEAKKGVENKWNVII